MPSRERRRNYAYDDNTNRCAVAVACDGSYSYDNADRLTSSPDDLAVAGGDSAWQTVGRQLLTAARQVAARRGAVQLVVVAGAHDSAKRQAVESEGLSETSIWYTGPTGA